MTLSDIEDYLRSRGLRLRKAVRSPERRRHVVEVQDERTGKVFEATGTDLAEAIENALAIAEKGKRTRAQRRYWS